MPDPLRTSRRVEFGDTDMAGIMHFSNFFKFMEVAETDFLHSLGFSVSWLNQGIKMGFPRVSVQCDYHSPAKFEDVLTIAVAVEKVGTKSVTYRFDFIRGDTSIATGRMTSVFCQASSQGTIEPKPIPEVLRSQLQKLTGDPSQ